MCQPVVFNLQLQKLEFAKTFATMSSPEAAKFEVDLDSDATEPGDLAGPSVDSAPDSETQAPSDDAELDADHEQEAETVHELEQVNSEEEEEGQNDDDVEDDDVEDDDDDDDDDAPRKRRRKLRRNQFLDVEAEVDDEEEDLEDDEDELGRDDGFIQEPDAEDLEGAEEPIHRQVDRRRETEITEEEAERLADEYREKYGRSAANKYRGDSGVVPQRLLLPSVHDPSIFGINCRIGKEKEAIRALLRKKINLQYGPNPLEIFSAFQRDAFPGRIYVEARNQKAALQACKGVVHLFSQSKILLVPIKEYPDLFRVRKSQDTELVPGAYVRVKRGKYAGDLAVVENLSENGLEVQLRLVPRLDYGRAPIIDTASGQSKRKRATATDRPPQRLFSASDAGQYDARNLQRRGQNSYVYAADTYENGYLIKDFKLTLISTEGVNPTLEEITKLTNAKDEGIDLQSLSESLRRDTKTQAFQPGEMVEVTQGEQAGLRGRVTDSSGDIVSIVGTEGNEGVKVAVPSGLLRKYFVVGDHVRVTAGNYKDDTGLVVQRSKDKVTLLSDLSQTEVTVFAKDLKTASDIGGSNVIGQYALHDLVQLNAQTVGCIVDIERERVKVLAQDGQIVAITPSAIVGKITSGREVATDKVGRQIEVGDKVREAGGERREGTILRIYHQFAFLQNRELTENLGIFVNRVHHLMTVQTKNARDERGLDLSKMNPNAAAGAPMSMAPPPARSNFNARRILGQKVAIGAGSSYKGLKGTVRDVNDTAAQIELEARNKIITVDVTKLLFKSQNGGALIPFRDYISRPSGGLRTSMPPPRTPRHAAGAQTPAWASNNNNNGGRTPAWAGSGAGGGRTPAWAGSGASGGRTPAWGGAGSQTPAWNSGSRTPAWNASGGQTPAWNSGSRTPAWNAGSRTPAWNADGGRTPTWNADGSRTPAWNSNGGTTPGDSGPGYYSAATPGVGGSGVYESGPTPGASGPYATGRTMGVVATPAAWGDDGDDDVPKYEPESP